MADEAILGDEALGEEENSARVQLKIGTRYILGASKNEVTKALGRFKAAQQILERLPPGPCWLFV